MKQTTTINEVVNNNNAIATKEMNFASLTPSQIAGLNKEDFKAYVIWNKEAKAAEKKALAEKKERELQIKEATKERLAEEEAAEAEAAAAAKRLLLEGEIQQASNKENKFEVNFRTTLNSDNSKKFGKPTIYHTVKNDTLYLLSVAMYYDNSNALELAKALVSELEAAK